MKKNVQATLFIGFRAMLVALACMIVAVVVRVAWDHAHLQMKWDYIASQMAYYTQSAIAVCVCIFLYAVLSKVAWTKIEKLGNSWKVLIVIVSLIATFIYALGVSYAWTIPMVTSDQYFIGYMLICFACGLCGMNVALTQVMLGSTIIIFCTGNLTDYLWVLPLSSLPIISGRGVNYLVWYFFVKDNHSFRQTS